MKLIKLLLGICAYLASILFGLATIAAPFSPDTTASDKVGVFIIGLVLTIGLWKLGKWLVKVPDDQSTPNDDLDDLVDMKLKLLREVFYQLMKVNRGVINVMEFAIATGLSGKEAAIYLDVQAKEFNANYDVDAQGNIVYHFPVLTTN